MDLHRRFNYKNIHELKNDIKASGLSIDLCEDISVLSKPVVIGSRKTPNALGIHPMEGCDGENSGSPSDLTRRRYSRFARSGAGLVWFEATAVTNEARANPRQLFINSQTVSSFSYMLEEFRKEQDKEFSSEIQSVEVLQLTHSGRYSKPNGPKPIIAFHDPYLDIPLKLPQDYPVISDGEIERAEDAFVDGARLAYQAGFRIIDIKACHRYLASELLAAYTRSGRYGGSYENRTRFIKNIIGKIKAELGSKIDIATRLNVFDGIPYPYGFGMSRNDALEHDLEEPVKLVRELEALGVVLINVSVGNPYYNPHFGRPYDIGPYKPQEHPLEGVDRMFRVTEKVQQAVPKVPIVGTGYSWLRHFAPYAAAYNISSGRCSIAGFGRQAFAYPAFARDILEKSQMNPAKACITCSNCSVIMRDGGRTGCVPFDQGIYGPIFKEGRSGKPELTGNNLPNWHI